MPDEARDGQNVALKFLSDCWCAQSSKEEFLQCSTLSHAVSHGCFAVES